MKHKLKKVNANAFVRLGNLKCQIAQSGDRTVLIAYNDKAARHMQSLG